jgi:mannose-1-phosphate guanylyltransferase/phosphomannomutase
MQAAIVAGGFGTRAVTMTGDRIPKALLPVGGIPIIVRQIEALRREGVRRITVLGGHHGDQLRAYLEPEAASLDVEIDVIVEAEPLGTAGCLTALAPSSEETIIVYGDMLFGIALGPFLDFHRRHMALLTVAAHPNDHPRTSDLVAETEGLLTAVLPRQQPRDNDHRNIVPAGIYIASPAFLRDLPRAKADMISDILPALIAAGAPIGVYNTPEYMRDVGTPVRHAAAERDLAAGRVEALHSSHRRPAVFFDCDGVLNVEPGAQGVIRPDDVVLIEGAAAAVRCAREAGFVTVGITNRPQVAKGFVSFEGLSHILGRLEALLAEQGGILDRLYFCPHHPEAGFPGEVAELKIRCECRKPSTLLLRRAFADLPIDRAGSVMIGDSLRDIGAARGAGIRAYGVRTGHGCRDVYPPEAGPAPTPDLMFDTVREAVEFATGYRALVEDLVARLRSRPSRSGVPTVVAFAGRSRSGKTMAAHALARTLAEQNVKSLHVHLDQWIVSQRERDPDAGGEARARVAELPAVVADLRAGRTVTAPGYDAASRGRSAPATYDPGGCAVIVLDGSFAAHRTLRAMLDIAVFVESPEALQRERFISFYTWKGLARHDIDQLWDRRASDEWPAVDLQRDHVDLVLTPTGNSP